MIIESRFPGKCAACGGRFGAGTRIEWTSGQPSRHADCPPVGDQVQARTARSGSAARGRSSRAAGSTATERPRARRAARQPRRELQPGEQQIQRRAGGGEYDVGATLHCAKVSGGGGPDGRYWTVTHAYRVAACEDQGAYDALEVAHVRPATDEECAPVVARIARAAARAACERALDQALRAGASVSDVGHLPPASETEVSIVLGRKTGSSGAVTDGGTTYAVTASAVVSHHGGHYDDYRSVTRTAERTDDLADLVRALAADDADALARCAARLS